MPNFSNYAEQLAAHTKIFHGKDKKIPLSFVRKKRR
jgi:hypothetical protein